jgi:hypothetical protein
MKGDKMDSTWGKRKHSNNSEVFEVLTAVVMEI